MGISAAILYSTTVAGYTLYNRIRHDKLLAMRGSKEVKFGGRYFKELKEVYMTSSENTTSSTEIRPDNAEEKLDESLVDAVEVLVTGRKDPSQLEEWFGAGKKPNERELCAILRRVLELNPKSSAPRFNCILAGLRWIRKHDLDKEHKDHISRILPKADQTLQVALQKAKVGKEVGKFVGARRVELSVLWDLDKLDKVMQHQKSPEQAEKEVRQLCETGLGKKMFGGMLAALNTQGCTKIIDIKIKEWCEGQEMTSELLEGLSKAAYDAVKEANPKTLPRRKVWLTYRGGKFPVWVDTVLHEIQLRIWCHIKEFATRKKLLDPVVYENDLANDATPLLLAGVEASLLPQSSLGRARMNEAIRAFQTQGPAALKECLLSKETDFIMNGKMMRIEVNWLRGMSGEAGEKMLHDMIEPYVPSQTNKFTVAQTYLKVGIACKCALMNFVEKTVSGDVKSYFDVLHSLNLGQAPELQSGSKQSEWLQRMIGSLGFFLREENPKAGDPDFVGVQVLQHRYRDLQKLTPGEAVHLQPWHLTDLRIYWFLLKPEWKADVCKAEKLLRSRHGLPVSDSPAASSSKDAGTAKQKKQKVDGKSNRDLALSLM